MNKGTLSILLAAATLGASAIAIASTSDAGTPQASAANTWSLVMTVRNGDRFDDSVMDSAQSAGDCYAATLELRPYFENVNGASVAVTYACELEGR